MLLILSPHRVGVRGDRYALDADLHRELCCYAERLGGAVACLAVRETDDDGATDGGTIVLAPAELPYELRLVDSEAGGGRSEALRAELAGQLEGVTLVAGAATDAMAATVFEIAGERQVPCVPLVDDTGDVFGGAAGVGIVGRVLGAMRSHAQQRQVRKQLRGAAAVQCVGFTAHEQCVALNPDAVVVLHSRLHAEEVVSVERVHRRVASLHNGRRPRLFWAGHLEEERGVLEIVGLALELRRLGQDFRLQIFGRGSLRGEIERRIEQEGAQRFVEVHGPLSWADQRQVMNQSDLSLSFGYAPGVVRPVLEAMGAGLPVLGPSCGSLGLLADMSSACVVVPEDNVAAAARAARRVLRDRSRLLSLSLAARRFAGAHCAERQWERRVEHWRPLLERVPAPAGAGEPSAATPSAAAEPVSIES